jgi:hypothetical protein
MKKETVFFLISMILTSTLLITSCGTLEITIELPESTTIQIVEAEPSSLPQTETSTHTEVEPTTLPVYGWLGAIISLPDEPDYDDALVLSPDGTGTIGVTGEGEIAREIDSLRDKTEPGKFAHFWGTLICGNVNDVNNCQLQVTRIRYGASLTTGDPVDQWKGQIKTGTFNGGETYIFELDSPFPMQYGIFSSNNEALVDLLDAAADTGIPVLVSGELLTGFPDVNGSRIEVSSIEPLGKLPATGERKVEAADGWIGTILTTPEDSLYDDYFRILNKGENEYGITGMDDALESQIAQYRDSEQTIQIWGTLRRDINDYKNSQIEIYRIEPWTPE